MTAAGTETENEGRGISTRTETATGVVTVTATAAGTSGDETGPEKKSGTGDVVETGRIRTLLEKRLALVWLLLALAH
ncbi:hypothetical protein CF328_g4003 [Tilletia controversa]|nr:hypothetical protein CF328_g4003 [Tilletia controversa]